MDIEIRTITEDEFEESVRSLELAFSGRPAPEDLARERLIAEIDRSLAAFEDGRIVGSAVAASYVVTVPGGAQVAAAGVTAVGVQPTHRRRGINTALMRAQLDAIHERGEALAMLYASEGGIYGRYGYGMAAYLGEFKFQTGRSAFIRGYRPTGRVRLLEREDALSSMRPVYDEAQRRRPGMVALDDRWWQWLFFENEKDEPPFFAVHDTDGVTDAFAVYRVKHEWPDSILGLELTVNRLMATTPQAYADIWRYLFDIDLVQSVNAWNRPVDEPLFLLMQEPRRLRFRTSDGLHTRLVDVPAALDARGYVGEGRLVLDVQDPFCPWNEGRYALEVSGGAARCTRTDEAPNIACSATDLGATYLSGVTFRQLHRAGRVDELSAGALATADALFAGDLAPWNPFMF